MEKEKTYKVKELPGNISICSECGKQTNDDVSTHWDYYADPFCDKCWKNITN